MVGLLEYHPCPSISIWRESICTLEYLQGALGIAKVSNVMEELTGVTGGCICQSEAEGEVGYCMLKNRVLCIVYLNAIRSHHLDCQWVTTSGRPCDMVDPCSLSLLIFPLHHFCNYLSLDMVIVTLSGLS